MVLPKDIKPEEVLHPTGVFYRNPTHKHEADSANDQSQIVRALSKAKREHIHEVITYTDESKPWVLPGFAMIRTMDATSIKQLCKNLMRFRPNIFKVHIKFGDYKSARPIETNKTRLLSSFEPRFHTDVAEKIADVISDQSLRVTEVIYTVHSSEPGNFRAIGEVFGMVSDKEWADQKLITPTVLIEYFTNH